MAAATRLSKQHSCSLDHLVRELLNMQRQIEAERLGGLEVDEDFEFRWMLHGQIGGFYAPEYLISIDCPLSELIDRIEAIGDQSKRFLAEA